MGYIGDSRAILGSKDSSDSLVAVQLTVDLKPDLPSMCHEILANLQLFIHELSCFSMVIY